MHEQGECIIVGLFALKVGPNIAILILIFFPRVVFSPSQSISKLVAPFFFVSEKKYAILF